MRRSGSEPVPSRTGAFRNKTGWRSSGPSLPLHYRRFGDRETLVDALGIREARRCLALLDAAVDTSAPLADQVADGFLASMRIAREHPLLNRLARFEPEAVLAAVTAEDCAIFGLMREWLTPRLDDEQAAELLVRVCVSFVLIQDSVLPLHDERATRATAHRIIAPMVMRPALALGVSEGRRTAGPRSLPSFLGPVVHRRRRTTVPACS